MSTSLQRSVVTCALIVAGFVGCADTQRPDPGTLQRNEATAAAEAASAEAAAAAKAEADAEQWRRARQDTLRVGRRGLLLTIQNRSSTRTIVNEVAQELGVTLDAIAANLKPDDEALDLSPYRVVIAVTDDGQRYGGPKYIVKYLPQFKEFVQEGGTLILLVAYQSPPLQDSLLGQFGLGLATEEVISESQATTVIPGEVFLAPWRGLKVGGAPRGMITGYFEILGDSVPSLMGTRISSSATGKTRNLSAVLQFGAGKMVAIMQPFISCEVKSCAATIIDDDTLRRLDNREALRALLQLVFQ